MVSRLQLPQSPGPCTHFVHFYWFPSQTSQKLVFIHFKKYFLTAHSECWVGLEARVWDDLEVGARPPAGFWTPTSSRTQLSCSLSDSWFAWLKHWGDNAGCRGDTEDMAGHAEHRFSYNSDASSAETHPHGRLLSVSQTSRKSDLCLQQLAWEGWMTSVALCPRWLGLDL